MKKVTELKCSTTTAKTPDGSQDSEQEKRPLTGPNVERQNELEKKDASLHKAIDAYVDGRKWDTLVGRAWSLNDESSRKEFKDFLYKHTAGIVKAGERIGLLEGMNNNKGVG